MPDLDGEKEFFDQVTSADLSDDPAPQLAPAPAQEPQTDDSPDDVQPPTPQGQEPQRAGGDLNVALRQAREAERNARAQNEQLQAQIAQLMKLVQPAQAPKSEPEQPKPAIWDDPDAWVGQLVQPVQSEVQRTREFFSRRFAETQHGKERVDEAYAALDAAVSRGELNRDAVLRGLQQSLDPFGDIVGWFENQPQNAEKRIREKVMEELRTSGQLPARDEAGRFQAQTPASVPGAQPLPSVNRAQGQSGPQQGGPVTDEDIFNSAPAFGRRKA